MKRKVSAGIGVLAIAGLVAGCSSPTGSESAGSGAWSFTDDRGVTVRADEQPKRVIGQVSSAAALQDFGVPITGTFGPLTSRDGSKERQAGSIDPARVTDVTGNSYGELNMERVATTRPDILVSGKYAGFGGLWHLNEQQERKVTEIAPTAGIQQDGKPLPEVIGRYEDLAGALGADVTSPKVEGDKRAFEAASRRIADLGAKLREQHRSILTVGGTREQYYVVSPKRNPDLAYYVEQLGLPITEPANPDMAGGGYFEHLSWERASAYQGDILLWDTREASLPPEQMKQNPTFASLPAARADRFVPWDALAPYSYASYAETMNRLADQIEAKAATL